ncbi:MAG: DUF4271 domain-containing protein [Bacteroidales bacterium]|nr:DUF4271 domain-containing protein [Bacteroidales bacterium]
MNRADSLNISLISVEDTVAVQKQSTPRFFRQKGEIQMNEIIRVEPISNPIWVHLSLLFWVFAIVFARQSYTLRLKQIITATLNAQQVKQLLREGSILKQGFPVVFMLMNYFTIALFLFIFINEQFPNSFYFSLGQGFLLLFGGVIMYNGLKFVAIWLIGFLFDNQSVSLWYLIDYFLFQISEGFALFPLLILFVYAKYSIFLYLALIVLLLFWLFRLKRALVIGLADTNFSSSYLFLYLCTLEVIPFILLYKLGLEFI